MGSFSQSSFAAGKCDSSAQKVNVKCDNKEVEKKINPKIAAASAACKGLGGSAQKDCLSGIVEGYLADMDDFETECDIAEKECDQSCTQPEDEGKKNQCKKKAGEAKKAAEGAKSQAKNSKSGGDDIGKMLGALAGLAAAFMKPDEQKPPEQTPPCVGLNCAQTAAEDKPVSSGGNLASSGYRAYTAGQAAAGAADIGGAKGDLAKSNGAGATGGGKVGAASAGSMNFGSGNGGGAIGAANGGSSGSAKEEGLDKNLGEGFYGGGGGSGGKNDPGEYSSSGGGQAFSQASLDSGSASAYSKQKLQGVLDQAKALGRMPAGLGQFSGHDGTGPNGDNFNRVHERYRMINFSEQLEDVQ